MRFQFLKATTWYFFILQRFSESLLALPSVELVQRCDSISRPFAITRSLFDSFEKRGERVFDVKIEGKEIADIDLIKYGGGIPNKALTREMPVTIDDGFLSLEFIKNEPMASEPKLSGIEVKLIGVHYCHAVIGGPYAAVDADANGYEMVAVDASQSHTHAPGHTLKSFTWKLGKEVVGTGEKPILKMPVGKHDISLTVVDTSGDVHSDFTTITVKPDGYPDISSLVPVSGDVAGGNQVTIKGAALATANEVKFGLVTLAGSDIKIVDAQTIVVTAPISTIGVPVAVTVVTPFGLSNSRQYTYIDANPIAFNINKLTTFANPTAVNFGPDGKLYVANTKGQLGRFVLNDSYDTVVSSVIATIGDGTRGIHCIAFDPMETAELGDNLSVYISTSFIFHKQPNNSAGLGVNGKIQTVKGANLDIVTNIITGLPVSELDHSVSGRIGDGGNVGAFL
jgi:IPT/TIG domain/Malectin domain